MRFKIRRNIEIEIPCGSLKNAEDLYNIIDRYLMNIGKEFFLYGHKIERRQGKDSWEVCTYLVLNISSGAEVDLINFLANYNMEE